MSVDKKKKRLDKLLKKAICEGCSTEYPEITIAKKEEIKHDEIRQFHRLCPNEKCDWILLEDGSSVPHECPL